MIPLLLLIVLPLLSRSEHCKEPDNSKLPESTMSSVHDSFYQIQPLLQTVMGLSDVPPQYVNIKIGKIGRKRKCSKLEHLAKRNAGNLCPSYYVFNYDNNRKPNTLLETRCSCDTCFDPNSADGSSTLLSCQPLVYHTRVLRRFGCVNGTYQYQTTWEPLQVGCTCNFPRYRSSRKAHRHTPKAPAKRDLRSTLLSRVFQSHRL